MLLLVLRWIAAIVIAFLAGKLLSKIKLPAILGWLIAGMLLGPYAFGLMPDELMNAAVYKTIIHVLECGVGFMIGTELVWKRLREYGKALIITTLTQSIGTFLLVSGAFSVIFAIRGIPIYLAFLFGGIALATAPAPALSIVQEFKTEGPVTKTLIPMAALDDMVTEERLTAIIKDFNPLLAVFMIIVILNLGAPLDYHAILGAGFYTVVYIVVRAFGKYFGARFGARVTKMPKPVQKYLGFTLLPHSGVSLVFTGIAVSVLSTSAPECAGIIQGTIAAAAVINEVIAVIVAKKGFEWAGEI